MSNTTENRADFSTGSMRLHIIRQAWPMIIAQAVQLLYSLVDRIYIGHLPDVSSIALTGVGLTFPIITMISAVTNLFGTGGTALFAIESGAGNRKQAHDYLGNTFSCLALSSVLVMILFYLFLKPILYLFGASDQSFPYAYAYLSVYLIGTPLIMIATGMNGFITAQGFPKIGMMTVLFGAILNLVIDPVFIFILGMGVTGAAAASVLSQLVSFLWVLRFLTGRSNPYPLKKSSLKIQSRLLKNITGLGLAGFVMSTTNALVQIVCNAVLGQLGGDLYIGIMTVIASVRDVINLPLQGLTDGGRPVLGYNYGAGCFDRVRQGIRFLTVVGLAMMLIIWAGLLLFPESILSLFTHDEALITSGVFPMFIYFFGIFLMTFQFVGQTVFTGLGLSKYAVFFSLFRKVIIVVPLTLLLPKIASIGVYGVFLAEPISNLIGGLCCYTTMQVVTRRMFREKEASGSQTNHPEETHHI